jgi:MATE family multidrug resistance protein
VSYADLKIGGTTAIDTLASASFTGSKNKHDLGIILQRALVVLTVFYIPIAILWIFSGPVFRALGQEEYIVRDGSRFLTVLIPGGLGYIYFECMKKYLQAQEIMRPGSYVLLITSPINAGLNYLFVYTFDFGLFGAPLATSISYWLSFLLLLAYARFVAGWECWGGFDRKSFQNMLTFVRIAALGVVHVGTEWWAFEIVAIVAGQLGTISLASQSVIMTADQVMYCIPFGIGVATSARVGNLLGARDAKGAALAANTAAWLSMLMGAIVLTVLMSTKDNFARLFNDDEDVVRLTARVLPYVALFQIADGLNGSCGGSLRGMGRQHVGAAVNIISYYCGALPLGIWLAFHGWGLAGLWFGQCLALYLVGFVEWAIVAFSNWNKQVENAFSRMDPMEREELGVYENGDDQNGECR